MAAITTLWHLLSTLKQHELYMRNNEASTLYLWGKLLIPAASDSDEPRYISLR